MKIETLVEAFDDTMSYDSKVKMDIPLKSGTVIPMGTVVKCEFDAENTRVFRVTVVLQGDEFSFKMPYRAANKYLSGFTKEPSMRSLEKYNNDGICPSVLGARVEPDGHGPHGEPSWMLVLGLI